VKSQRIVKAIIGKNTEESECVRESLFTFETKWFFRFGSESDIEEKIVDGEV